MFTFPCSIDYVCRWCIFCSFMNVSSLRGDRIYPTKRLYWFLPLLNSFNLNCLYISASLLHNFPSASLFTLPWFLRPLRNMKFKHYDYFMCNYFSFSRCLSSDCELIMKRRFTSSSHTSHHSLEQSHSRSSSPSSSCIHTIKKKRMKLKKDMWWSEFVVWGFGVKHNFDKLEQHTKGKWETFIQRHLMENFPFFRQHNHRLLLHYRAKLRGLRKKNFLFYQAWWHKSSRYIVIELFMRLIGIKIISVTRHC